MSVVGIDFGNEKCVVAIARRGGIDIVLNDAGQRSTPNIVAYHGQQRFMGVQAAAQYMGNSQNSITQVKRFLGRRYDDPSLSQEPYFPYSRVKLPNGNIGIEVSYGEGRETFTPEQIAASMFSRLKQYTELALDGHKVADCVISCPPWWTEAQRKALLDAANIAGWNVLRLMNETTAIALNYGLMRPLPKDHDQKVLFVDMGHSTTNVAVVNFKEGQLTVLGTSSDPFLAARDFDHLVSQHLAAEIKEKFKIDPFGERKPTVKLLREAARVKKDLSANAKLPYYIENLMNERDVKGEIDRATFEGFTSSTLLPRLYSLVEAALDSAGVKKDEVHSMEIVGGGVRIPSVQKGLHEFFGRDLSKTCDGDESVARGCALMCAMLSPTFKVREFDVKDITPYAVQLSWGPIAEPFVAEEQCPLLAVNNPLPNVKLISFANRTSAFQTVISYADPSKLPAGTNPVIGKYIVSGFPTPATKIKLRIKLTLHGTIDVTSAQLIEEIKDETPAADAAPVADAAAAPAENADAKQDEDKKDTEEKKKIKVKKTDIKVESFPASGLDGTTLSSFFEKEVSMLNQDRLIMETEQARNDLESYVFDMRRKISEELAKFVLPVDAESFQNALNKVEEWLYDSEDASKNEYKKHLEDLHKFGIPISKRKYEHEHRDEYVKLLKTAIGHFQKLAMSMDDKYSHIDLKEKEKVANECGIIDQWLATILSKQDHIPLHENPAVTCEELQQKKIYLDNLCNPIFNKPKPAPPKEEKKPEPQPQQPQQEAPKPEQAHPEQPMDTSS